jgi:hypothetical protein
LEGGWVGSDGMVIFYDIGKMKDNIAFMYRELGLVGDRYLGSTTVWALELVLVWTKYKF